MIIKILLISMELYYPQFIKKNELYIDSLEKLPGTLSVQVYYKKKEKEQPYVIYSNIEFRELNLYNTNIDNKKKHSIHELLEIYKNPILRKQIKYFIGSVRDFNDIDKDNMVINSSFTRKDIIKKDIMEDKRYIHFINSVFKPRLMEHFDTFTPKKYNIGLFGTLSGNKVQAHYDCANRFLLHLYGEKTFYLLSPEYIYRLKQNPYFHENHRQFITKDLREDTSLLPYIKEYKLKPGDLIVIPFGWIHQCISPNETLSLGISNITDERLYDSLNIHQKTLTIFLNIDITIGQLYSVDILLQWHINWIKEGTHLYDLEYIFYSAQKEFILLDNKYHSIPECNNLFIDISKLQYSNLISN